MIQRLTLWVLVANIIVLLVNACGSALVYQSQRLNDRTAEMNRQITEQLPPHPCRAVILPGERCTATTVFKLRREPDL